MAHRKEKNTAPLSVSYIQEICRISTVSVAWSREAKMQRGAPDTERKRRKETKSRRIIPLMTAPNTDLK